MAATFPFTTDLDLVIKGRQLTTNKELVSILQKLVNGEFTADEWLDWWEANSELLASELNRGQWLRLKPPQPGGFGPPCRCTLASQQGASKLLSACGVEHACSDRYQQEWDAAFKAFAADQKQQRKEKREQFLLPLNCLRADFPKLSSFLGRNLDEVEELGPPASSEEIEHLEDTLGANLPESYRRFLFCTSSLVYEDGISIGLPFTFRHPSGPYVPSADQICFGEYWLESDGDQVLFGEVEANGESPVLYYSHGESSCQVLAIDFKVWIESLPDSLGD